jgi:hypothetical protein
VAEQAPVAKEGEAHEVVRAAVNLLHERRLCVNETTWCQHALDLIDAAVGIDDVLKDGLGDDRVEAAVGEGDVVRV